MKYIECSSIEQKNVKKVFDEAIRIAMINETNHDGIHRAAEEGQTDLVKLLLDHGVNVNEKDNDGNRGGSH